MDDDVAYKNTTIIVVGLNGSDERPTSEDVPTSSYTPDWVLKQLQTKSTEDACAQWFESAQREGRIALTDGGFLQSVLTHVKCRAKRPRVVLSGAALFVLLEHSSTTRCM